MWLGLSAWAIIILAWIANAAVAPSREQRLKRLRRLPVWLLILSLEAGLYYLGDLRLWLVVYALASIWALGELLRLWSNQVGPLLIGVTSAALAAWVEPDLLAACFLLLLVVLFALPYHPSVHLVALAGACGGIFFASPPLLLVRLVHQPGMNELLYLATTGVHLIDIVSGVAGKGERQHPFDRLSPSKSSRGFAAGFLTGVTFSLCWSAWVLGRADVASAFVAGTFLWLSAAIGDLAASKLKRIAGAKDFGSILGAHGGLGDRIDSLSPTTVLLGFWISYMVPR
jgi:phosphatidate cytidylyltransferase